MLESQDSGETNNIASEAQLIAGVGRLAAATVIAMENR